MLGEPPYCQKVVYPIFIENRRVENEFFCINERLTGQIREDVQDLHRNLMDRQAAISALQWHIDVGADEALSDTPVDATVMPDYRKALGGEDASVDAAPQAGVAAVLGPAEQPASLLGASEAREEALRLAKAAGTRDELREAVANFDGLPLKKTATKLVFSDGSPEATIMLIGEVPGDDEDRSGKPFAGANGALLDQILACIDLARDAEDTAKAVYLTSLLNWRPPGNRSLNASEIEVSLPFLERHIALVKPKLLILCGGTVAKALLRTDQGLSKLRGKFHNYQPGSAELSGGALPDAIPALVTYSPAMLLSTPAKKRLVWQDMLALQNKIREAG